MALRWIVALAALHLCVATPVAVTLVSNAYAPLIPVWVREMAKAELNTTCIVARDAETAHFARRYAPNCTTTADTPVATIQRLLADGHAVVYTDVDVVLLPDTLRPLLKRNVTFATARTAARATDGLVYMQSTVQNRHAVPEQPPCATSRVCFLLSACSTVNGFCEHAL